MNRNKGTKKLIMLFVMMIATLAMTIVVSAASKPELLGGNYRMYYTAKNQKQYNKQPLYFNQSGDKITKIQSSNKSVATIYNGSYSKQKAVMINLKKAGKTKFTVWVKRGKTTYKLRKTVTVYKSNAFKTVKIGNSSNLATMMNGYHARSDFYVKGKSGKLSGKVTVKLNSGWKLKSLEVVTTRNYSEDEDATTSVKKIKNGATVTLRADTKVGSAYEWDCLCITYMNTKTKALTRREIYVK